MASAAHGASPTTPSAGSLPSPIGSQKDGSFRQTKSTSAKITERGRKESPVDQTRRPQPKAWTGGSNPLTQKPAASTQANGNTAQAKSNAASKMPASRDGRMSDKHSHERLCFILGGCVGLVVTLIMRNGEAFEGILAGSSLNGLGTKVTLQMTKKVPASESQANGVVAQEAALVGTSPEHAMTFELKDMIDLSIPQFTLPEASKQANGPSSSFQTDTDISAGAGRGAERVLQPWVADGPDNTDFSLESGSIGGWDQFAAHKKKFGDTSTYDENLYTTTINRSAPDYARREANARRVAGEINAEVSTIAHVREERGHVNEDDNEDEEDKYSGVRREEHPYPPLTSGGANKYMPPARRAPTALPTVPGAPVDSAIISAQLSKPGGPKTPASKATAPGKDPSVAVTTTEPRRGAAPVSDAVDGKTAQNGAGDSSKSKSKDVGTDAALDTADTETSAQSKPNSDNPTEDVEVQVLDKFRQFANIERQRFADRKRAQVSQDRTAKLNDLVRFAKTFKLKTPVPTDLVGILAKDPVKQEAIVSKAQQQHDEAKSVAPASTTAASASAKPSSVTTGKNAVVPKFDHTQVPSPIPARDTFNRGLGGPPRHGPRTDRTSQPPFLSRGAPSFGQRNAGQQDRKGHVPAPIPLPDGRALPAGPVADHNPSPHRSAAQTPTSAASMRFNAKATEFRPNANAPAFNPSSASNAPSSPASVPRTVSVSRSVSPSSFFGAHKPRPASERIHVLDFFDPIGRMRKDIEKRKAEKQETENVKGYPDNGGIPNAYHTAPTWIVREENKDKKYTTVFSRAGPFSPSSSRSSTAQHVPYPAPMPLSANGVPSMSTPQHGHPAGMGHHFDEHRMPIQGTPAQVYSSPGMSVRQLSNYSSPLPPQAQLAYGQQHYYGGPGRMPMQMRQFPTTPTVMHAQPGQMAAPMMMQQQSSGPYMAVPQQYGQMQMYSPGSGHVYPQPNGYPSPGRMAPMMMHQGSQHSHHGGQAMGYGMSNQGNPMGYANPGGPMMGMRPGYGDLGGQYGSGPHQPPHMQQRTMSSGYGQRSANPGVPAVPGHGPPPNAPHQPAAFAQMEMTTDESK